MFCELCEHARFVSLTYFRFISSVTQATTSDMQFCSISKGAIQMLDLIIVYGTNAAISFHPSTVQVFNTSPCSLWLPLQKNFTCPLSEFFTPAPSKHPWRGPLLLLSFYLESEASGEQALSLPLSITLNNCDVHSTLHPFHSLSAFLSPYLCSVPPGSPSICKMSQLLNTRLLLVMHLSFMSISF